MLTGEIVLRNTVRYVRLRNTARTRKDHHFQARVGAAMANLYLRFAEQLLTQEDFDRAEKYKKLHDQAFAIARFHFTVYKNDSEAAAKEAA